MELEIDNYEVANRLHNPEINQLDLADQERTIYDEHCNTGCEIPQAG